MQIKCWKHKETGHIFENEADYNKHCIKYQKDEELREKIRIKQAEYSFICQHVDNLMEKAKAEEKQWKISLKQYLSEKTKEVNTQIDEINTTMLKCKTALKICTEALKNQKKDYTNEYVKAHPDPGKVVSTLQYDLHNIDNGYIPTKYKKIAKELCSGQEEKESEKKMVVTKKKVSSVRKKLQPI